MRAKSTGQTGDADDIVFCMLFCKLLRSSTVPHAKITLKTIPEKLWRYPVKAVITGKDDPHCRSPPSARTNILALNRVRMVGEFVAAIAAVDG